MSLRIVRAAARTESADALHLARLLLLLLSADASKTTVATKAKAVEGITKLAKLDFLLRYPVYLERALKELGIPEQDANVLPRERTTVETKMIRFRYGPWDDRYRRWLGLLHARGLVKLSADGRKVEIGLTDRGRNLALDLAGNPDFHEMARRGAVVVDAVGNMAATAIKDFVYRIVPEITGLRWGVEIDPVADEPTSRAGRES